ncbi:hypothetical protein [Virgibacillus halodenitrificans]|uniref:hypothetical protein n=1 Tax=Virgibacillus halodenitrificans TaxID=1482 RepID=UPI00045C68A6|nr:hypothetical protein [Virgibacillus halodenitrificans]CDQ31902.1 hypothetical protein BN993_01287 [Virgibacillus halodenitrificans]
MNLSMNEMKAMDDRQIGKKIYDSISKKDQRLLEIKFNHQNLEQLILELGGLYREAAEEAELDGDVGYEDFQIFVGFFLEDEGEWFAPN